ncbi:MAG TPA: ATP-binding protein, partial [Tepidisphaeraceae bacterium]|nr:ATP-binding protein [Tepidisphaeraceae bacterium]
AAEVIGKPVSLLRPNHDGSGSATDWPPEVMERIRAGEPANAPFERVRRRKDGTLVEVLMSFSAIRDNDGTLVGISKIARDISERKKAERALRAAEEEAREAVRRRDLFLAMLSHELRNPMAAVLNACALLDVDGSNHESVETVCRTIGRQARHMARLLDDLLDVSRIARDKIEIRKQPIDLRQTARDAVETVRPLLERRQLELRLQLPDEPVCMDGDPARIQQIQVNLLGNAIKYTPDGGQVTLSLRQEGEDAVIHVRDSGIGIPVEMRQKIFDLFVQLNRTADGDSTGMGVGLTLVQALVRLHGGQISIDGGPGQGSDFCVRLPAISSDRLPPQQSEPEVSLQGLRVVLVEDIPDIRVVMQRLLKRMGCEVEAAENGRTAIQTITKVQPDVALVDIGLPELDGYEVARRIRARADLAAVRLIAVTGFGQEDDRRKAIEAGFDAHVVKPVDIGALRRLLASLATQST